MPKNSRQNIDARRASLLALLQQQEYCSVTWLAESLNTSEVTIRRELEYLSETGQVIRYHGGARLAHGKLPNFDLAQNYMAMQAEKDAIAGQAAAFVPDHATVMINSSSTAGRVIPYLSAAGITIATNNCRALSQKLPAGLSLLLIGGEMNSSDYKLSTVGSYALNMINSIMCDVCIIGVSGISAESGLTTKDLQDAPINSAMLHGCRGKVIVTADSRKIGITHNYRFAELSEIDVLITDSAADPAALEAIRAAGVQVIIA